jgi:hypothetical protein
MRIAPLAKSVLPLAEWLRELCQRGRGASSSPTTLPKGWFSVNLSANHTLRIGKDFPKIDLDLL